ncbi:uncharacterized protein LOC113509646 [Galleria mellonella]|uniref:Uncharacterized protein LOC113509646 n=1 Tax=Galleria mellonella TaxID=7137 RepID=A0A6J3C217_GALME|nr:uncharacterized protein LOC113509646 [Galleria mellonella]XP_026748826.1 uncharacterized protein LOC113509646 [Galleria mellonella]
MSFNEGCKMKENITEFSENKTKSTPVAMVAPEVKQNADNTEITKTCAVLGCEDFKNLDEESFFRFPEDANFRQIWTDLTGRNNWTPTDYSYICIQHFSVDCFVCDADDKMVLVDKAVPSLKLPGHVLEVEYIDEDTFDNEEDDEGEEYSDMDMDEMDDNSSVTDSKMMNDSKPVLNNRLVVETRQVTDNRSMTETKMVVDTKPLINTKILTNSKPAISNKLMTNMGMVNAKRSVNGTANINNVLKTKVKEVDNAEILKLFTVVQKMQRQAVGLKDKLKRIMKAHNRYNRAIEKVEERVERKKKILEQKRKRKARILLSLQDKIKEDTNGLVLAMPVRQTDDLMNFALSIYKYSPQAYIYVRNTLRTMLPNTDILDSWISSGYQPKNLLSNNNLIKVIAEQTENVLACKIIIG